MIVFEEQTKLVPIEDKAEIAVLKIISARLKEARGLTTPLQHEAAQLLGVSADDLRNWEDSVDAKSIPFSVIEKAAKMYDVSIDWLFGLVDDDWELCQEIRKQRDFSAHLQSLFTQKQAEVAVKLIEQENQLAALSNSVTKLAPAIKEIYGAIMKFWEVNPGFEDMKCGASIIDRLDRADKHAHEATCQLVRYGFLPPEALRAYSTIDTTKNEQKI